MLVLKRYRETSGERNFIKQISTPNFLEAVLAIETMQGSQSNLEEKDNFKTFKGNFFRNRLIHFHINSTRVMRLVKENKLSFPAMKSTSHFLPESTVSHRSNSSSQSNFSCCHKSDARSLRCLLTDNIIRTFINK